MTNTDDLIDRYIAIWNEQDGPSRRALIERTWSGDARYVDPMQSGDGRDGIDTMIAAVQGKFPGYRFRRAGAADGHNGHVRFGWDLVGPDGGAAVVGGTDFATISGDGRLQTVIGFIDMAPAGLSA